ncbi:hypothetical protein K7432_012243 [Basidiobolus ranarum]|uniref:Cupin type-1 domain-containing protein n=1 Tax=Basidiobolus ranarum TaxID=34480 RepID=A0ABR2VTF7_9FUNG
MGEGMCEPHWHPITAEMGYIAKGYACMTVMNLGGSLDTYVLRPGDVYHTILFAVIPQVMFVRTVVRAFAFCGLALGSGSEFSINYGSATAKCVKSISLGTRTYSASGATVCCRDQNV